jgi:hypothetical protein
MGFVSICTAGVSHSNRGHEVKLVEDMAFVLRMDWVDATRFLLHRLGGVEDEDKMEHCFNRVREAITKQAEARPGTDIFLLRLSRAIEELGEASRAYRDRKNSPHEIAPLSALVEETVDCIVSSLALFVATGARFDDLMPLFDRKVDKWCSNIENRRD